MAHAKKSLEDATQMRAFVAAKGQGTYAKYRAYRKKKKDVNILRVVRAE